VRFRPSGWDQDEPGPLLPFGALGHYIVPCADQLVNSKAIIMGTWIKCTNENGQDIYANLENATTIFRDEGRHRGTVIEFLGSHDAVVVRETPDQLLKLAKGENPN
jgi:hypothetical protein